MGPQRRGSWSTGGEEKYKRKNKSMNVMKICGHVGIGRAVHISTIPRGGMENGVRQELKLDFGLYYLVSISTRRLYDHCFLCSEC